MAPVASVAAKTSGGRSRLLAIALLGSLAVNLAAAGLGLGLWLSASGVGGGVTAEAEDTRRSGGGRPPAVARLPGGQQIKAALPPDAGPVVDAALLPFRAGLRQDVRAVRAARRAVAGHLRAEPFDPVALEDALAALRTREMALASGAHQGLVAVAAALPPDQRAILAALIEGRRPRPEPAGGEVPGR